MEMLSPTTSTFGCVVLSGARPLSQDAGATIAGAGVAVALLIWPACSRRMAARATASPVYCCPDGAGAVL